MRDPDLREIFDSLGAYFYVKDAQGRYRYVNQPLCRLFGESREGILGKNDSQFFDLDRSGALIDSDRLVLTQGQPLQHEEEAVLLADSAPRVFWSVKVPLRDDSGNISGLCGMWTEVAHRLHPAEDTIARDQLLNTILSHVEAYVYLKDDRGKYLYANQKLEEFHGYPEGGITGFTDHELFPEEVARQLVTMDREVMASGERLAREEVLVDLRGNIHHVWTVKVPLKLAGQPSTLIGFSSEITELLQLRENIEVQQTTDSITGLANRTEFERKLERYVQKARQKNDSIAVLLLDLDHFKYLNNTLGQQVGDDVLRAVARRLTSRDWLKGTVARLAGNEFAIVIPGMTSVEEVASIAERIRLLLAEPHELNGQPFHLTASLGISVYPEDASRAPQLIAYAESAMYHAKEQGRDRYCFYSLALGAKVAHRAELERSLRQAVANSEFELFYQPKMSAENGDVTGVEALIRWHRPGHGVVAPLSFITLAEEIGLIGQIGDWVIEQACRQLQQWRSEGLPPVAIAVNLSPSQLTSENLVERVDLLMEQYQVGPGLLHMEVTESMMMSNPEQAIERLQALQDLGVELAIDDFGVGYSSMAYLKRLPVSTLKLDRSFIDQISNDPRDRDLCAGMISLAHKLGLIVVAEGVETADQCAILKDMGCDQCQGYFYSKPVPIDELTAYLRRPA